MMNIPASTPLRSNSRNAPGWHLGTADDLILVPGKIVPLRMVYLEVSTADKAMLLLAPAGITVTPLHIHMPHLRVADVVIDEDLAAVAAVMVVVPAAMPFSPVQAAMVPVTIIVQPGSHTVGLAVVDERNRGRRLYVHHLGVIARHINGIRLGGNDTNIVIILHNSCLRRINKIAHALRLGA